MPDKGRIFVQPYGWVTPVRSRAGTILYYVDESGQRVGNPLAGPGSGGVGQYTTREVSSGTGGTRTERVYQDNSADAAARRADARDKRQTAAPVDAQQASQLNALNEGYAWIDGQRVRFVGKDAQGRPTYTLNGGGNPADGGNPYTLIPPSAYGALDGDAIPDGSTKFLMSVGLRRDAGNNVAAGFGDLLNPGMLASSNFMTIKNALEWLAALSYKDPEAYRAQVEKLHKAGYLSDAEATAGSGGFDTNISGAFARAARDVAVLNGQGGDGASLTLDGFLAQRAKGIEANGGLGGSGKQPYQPVQRSYTDPTAIKGAAKDAAEAALGRRLTDEEEQRLVGHFHSLESQVYDTIDAAGRADKGGATVTPPNASGQIDAFLESGELDQEQANYRAAQYGDALKQLFGVR